MFPRVLPHHYYVTPKSPLKIITCLEKSFFIRELFRNVLLNV
jgi:hypothetical protein